MFLFLWTVAWKYFHIIIFHHWDFFANSDRPSSVLAQISEVLVRYLLNTVRLKKLTVVQLVKKFHAVYETEMYIIVFTSAQHWFLSWDAWIQSISYIFSILSNIMPLPHLRTGLPCGLHLSGFPTKFVYTFLISPMRDTVDLVKVAMGTKLHESVHLRNS